MSESPDQDTDKGKGLSRRKTLATSAVAGTFALAGCLSVSEDGDNESESGEEATNTLPSKPSLPDNPSDLAQPERYIVASLSYQNDLLEEIVDQ